MRPPEEAGWEQATCPTGADRGATRSSGLGARMAAGASRWGSRSQKVVSISRGLLPLGCLAPCPLRCCRRQGFVITRFTMDMLVCGDERSVGGMPGAGSGRKRFFLCCNDPGRRDMREGMRHGEGVAAGSGGYLVRVGSHATTSAPAGRSQAPRRREGNICGSLMVINIKMLY